MRTSDPGFQPHKTIQNISQLTDIFVLSKAGFSSVAQSCLTLGNPMDCSTPGFLVYHQLLEFTQTHVRRVGDATQTSHPLSPPFPPALNLSQHQKIKDLPMS